MFKVFNKDIVLNRWHPPQGLCFRSLRAEVCKEVKTAFEAEYERAVQF